MDSHPFVVAALQIAGDKVQKSTHKRADADGQRQHGDGPARHPIGKPGERQGNRGNGQLTDVAHLLLFPEQKGEKSRASGCGQQTADQDGKEIAHQVRTQQQQGTEKEGDDGMQQQRIRGERDFIDTIFLIRHGAFLSFPMISLPQCRLARFSNDIVSYHKGMAISTLSGEKT